MAATIAFGYLFFAGWFVGFMLTKYTAGKTSGEPGRCKSIVIPLGKHGFHFHHWLISAGIIILSIVTNFYFLASLVFYGVLGGSVFQGIYSYSDWRKVLVHRRQHKESLSTCAVEDTRMVR